MITCYVLVVGSRDGQRLYGPFEKEMDADLWAVQNLPMRVMFQIVPVYDKLQP